MNKLFLTNARLGRDVEVRYSNDKAIARFSVATNRKFSKENKTDWFEIVCFGSQATFAEKYLRKGSKVNIIGRVQPDSYENKEGHRVKTFDVIAEEIEFAETKKEASAEQASKQDDGGFDANDGLETADEGFMNVPDDDDSLPFS